MNDYNANIEEMIIEFNRKEPFSGVILVKQNGATLFQGAYGYANRSEEIINKIDTRFGIASGCKIFTAVAICQLIERGMLTFDTMISDYLKESVCAFDPNITFHYLLTHSSGMPDYFDEETMTDYGDLWKAIPMYNMKTPRDFIPMFSGQPTKFKPGERFHYNNAGFIVLGLIVEKASGMSFTEYVDKNIFRPCRMDNSGYFSLDRLPGNVAYGYIEDDGNSSWKTNIYSIPIIGGPDGGAFVTAADMVRFWDGLFHNKLLSQEYTRKLTTAYVCAGEDEYYGYGIWINKRNDNVFKYHLMGGDPGVSFRSSVYPRHDTKIVVLSNKGHGCYAITKELESILF